MLVDLINKDYDIETIRVLKYYSKGNIFSAQNVVSDLFYIITRLTFKRKYFEV